MSEETPPSWQPVLDPSEGPRYAALADAIGRAVADGTFRSGQRLPARRALAARLGLSINTVSAAYLEAERRGLVSGEVGRGTFVLPAGGGPGGGPSGDARYFMHPRPTDAIDLSICRPAVGPDHAERLRHAFAELARGDDLQSMLACRPIIGFDAHRRAGAAWLNRHGVDAIADRLVLTNGCAHALTVALATLVEPGDLVVTESLTDHGIISLAGVLGFRLMGLETDEAGIRPEALAAAVREHGAKALVATPTLTNPTNHLMPATRRREIARIARHHDLAIVEDDVFRPLLADPPPPLAAFAPERTCYITSLTKVAMSGLRVGYLLAPPALVGRLAARVRATSWMATPLVAEIATRWIADGTLSALVDWQRRELAWRHALLNRRFAGFAHRSHPASIVVWMDLPDPWRARSLVELARRDGVLILDAEPFAVGDTAAPRHVRLSLGSAQSRAQLEDGLDLLRQTLAHHGEPVPIDI
jgi:DNA-binding transcriptional MocR family regulator